MIPSNPSSSRLAFLRVLTGYGLMISMAGCWGDDNGVLVPVSGTVTCNGESLSTGEINFVPEQTTARGAHGVILPDGSFKLSSYGIEDGAHPGKYKVTVIARGEDIASPENLKGSMMEEDMQGTGRYLVPTKYTSSTTTDLVADVSVSSSNHFAFKLTGEVTGGPDMKFKGKGRKGPASAKAR